MPYAKLDLPQGPTYAAVEERPDGWWAAYAQAGPEEDPLAPVEFRAAPLAEFRLLAPVRPSKIVCVGRNYRDHAVELGNDVPKEPLLFLKPPSALLAPGGTVLLPALSQRVDFEGELAMVVGQRCRNLRQGDDLTGIVRGYTLVNDVTARDLQKTDGQWTRGKGFDTFCPAGPIVSELVDPVRTAVTLATHLNGQQRQAGSTADLIFDIAALLVYITSFLTLEPGDLIPTGTPAGVGAMAAGDTVEVTAPGLGVLRNPVAAA